MLKRATHSFQNSVLIVIEPWRKSNDMEFPSSSGGRKRLREGLRTLVRNNEDAEACWLLDCILVVSCHWLEWFWLMWVKWYEVQWDSKFWHRVFWSQPLIAQGDWLRCQQEVCWKTELWSVTCHHKSWSIQLRWFRWNPLWYPSISQEPNPDPCSWWCGILLGDQPQSLHDAWGLVWARHNYLKLI